MRDDAGRAPDGAAAVTAMLDYPPVADELAARFTEAGHRLYLVGGSVRDALLGRPSPDLDFTTDARPDAITRIVSGWADAIWDTGIAFGTVGLRRRGATCEITTFRSDTYDGVSRNPTVGFGDTVEGDLVRRDFTANAMALSLPDRTFVDPCGGLAALARGVLDTPVDPEVSFTDDPLRLLRDGALTIAVGVVLGVRQSDDGEGIAAAGGGNGRAQLAPDEPYVQRVTVGIAGRYRQRHVVGGGRGTACGTDERRRGRSCRHRRWAQAAEQNRHDTDGHKPGANRHGVLFPPKAQT